MRQVDDTNRVDICQASEITSWQTEFVFGLKKEYIHRQPRWIKDVHKFFERAELYKRRERLLVSLPECRLFAEGVLANRSDMHRTVGDISFADTRRCSWTHRRTQCASNKAAAKGFVLNIAVRPLDVVLVESVDGSDPLMSYTECVPHTHTHTVDKSPFFLAHMISVEPRFSIHNFALRTALIPQERYSLLITY